ncbi:hypothetical protein RB195_011089 [Necator americanus]|uniref:Peptidase M13 C-terminal domain-containing protein n=1 Tax=Necator americanus TaxID=51031 RepID=A0ABR1D0T5_NECAM
MCNDATIIYVMTMQQWFHANQSKLHIKSCQDLRTVEHGQYHTHMHTVVGNLPEFAAAFHCEPDMPLNPNERCSIW